MVVRVTAEHSPLPLGLLRKIAIIGAAVLGCIVSAGAAMSEIFQIESPEAAAAAWPRNGFALNAIADEKLNETILTQQKPAQPASSGTAMSPEMQNRWNRITGTALHAYRLEPLNASALRSIAMAADARGDTGRAQKLMAHAVLFSRRDTAANNWQFTQALAAQDLPRSLRLVDRILRENDTLRLQYLPVLIAGVAEPEGFSALYPLLQKQPPWENEFWSRAASQPNIPAEMAVMRQKLFVSRGQKTPVTPFLVADVHMIRNLIRHGQFDAAKSLHDYLSGQGGDQKNAAVRGEVTTDFTSYDSAFDWQLTSQGDVQADVNDTGSGLSVETAANNIGVFARHLVKTDNGQFRIKITAQAVRGLEMFARLKCAEPGKKLPTIELNFASDAWSANQAIASDCGWFTLEILAQNKTADSAVLDIQSIVATSIN
jgi:hypothetical protein